jgi:hypothetical protein
LDKTRHKLIENELRRRAEVEAKKSAAQNENKSLKEFGRAAAFYARLCPSTAVGGGQVHH